MKKFEVHRGENLDPRRIMVRAGYPEEAALKAARRWGLYHGETVDVYTEIPGRHILHPNRLTSQGKFKVVRDYYYDDDAESYSVVAMRR